MPIRARKSLRAWYPLRRFPPPCIITTRRWLKSRSASTIKARYRPGKNLTRILPRTYNDREGGDQIDDLNKNEHDIPNHCSMNQSSYSDFKNSTRSRTCWSFRPSPKKLL